MADGDTKGPPQSSAPAPKPEKPKVTQAEPTAPRPRCEKTGLELDEHGLPTSGPARAAWLAEREIEDPALTETEN